MTQPRTEPPKLNAIKYTEMNEVHRDMQEVYRRMQPKTHRIFKVTPKAHELEEGEIVLYDDEATTRRIYTLVNSTLRYVNLT